MGWNLPHTHWTDMRSSQTLAKTHNPEIWAASLHRVWQWATFCVWDNPNCIRSLGIKRKFHIAYRPRSSGKVERMTRTLKTTLANLCQETQLSWVDMLPLALLWAQCTPKVLRLFSPWDLIWENTPSDRKTQGRPPTASWPGDVPTPPGPGKSLPSYRSRNLRKDTHSFGQLGSSVSARRWGMG